MINLLRELREIRQALIATIEEVEQLVQMSRTPTGRVIEPRRGQRLLRKLNLIKGKLDIFSPKLMASAPQSEGISSPQRRAILEKKYETQVSEIGGAKIKEKKGKLSDDLGKPAFQASASELDSYIDSSSGAEKKKRVARVNLMKAHKKGHKAQKKK